MASYRIKIIHEKSDDQFRGVYKGYEIEINREESGGFYIYVRNPNVSFGTTYDGYWGEDDNTMDEAIHQALLGSCLITPTPEPRP